MRRRWEVALADLGLSAPQAAGLRAIAEQPGQAVRAVARRLSTDAMNAKRLVDHLAAQGLVRTEPDPNDRRRRCVWPTDLGWERAHAVAGRAGEFERHLAMLLGPGGATALAALLRQLEAGPAGTDAPGVPPAGPASHATGVSPTARPRRAAARDRSPRGRRGSAPRQPRGDDADPSGTSVRR
ncbi:MAG TPA: MarR family winged helix-turn-helix transcriptional regulator [Candidatus Dormibacteraeota bacterium]|nr:MarR family winged helix-turn-helix transcriptional regulator [Candidatus Dormibacteraeota bacterium]